jgi:hypothetical protein
LLYIGIALFLFSFRENCDAQFSSDLNYAYDQYQSTLLSCQNYGIGKANCQTEANYAYNWRIDNASCEYMKCVGGICGPTTNAF